jgi:drug/metabolite transporter (DMT)-like permease
MSEGPILASEATASPLMDRSLHRLGVICCLAAGGWLGAAEVPTKLVGAHLSPYLISLGMVTGVFIGRWTLPMILRGTRYLVQDFRDKPHLIVWAILAGLLWAVANTLTIFAIRGVGLSIAFPLWNVNSLVGLFWGWLLFGELREAGPLHWIKVLGGTLAVLAGACMVSWATVHGAPTHVHSAAVGIVAALGAALLWGTMYIPYRKAYLSGMNPLSFVTVFTVGELAAVFLLALCFDGGFQGVFAELRSARSALFWLFLGGICWVVGDLFQQYAVKYIGIGRGIPLSNTDQLWGLAWGALAFGEIGAMGSGPLFLVIAGSLLMVGGALAIGMAAAPKTEQAEWRRAVERESARYGFDLGRAASRLRGEGDQPEQEVLRRDWWEFLVAAGVFGLLVCLARLVKPLPVPIDPFWTVLLIAGTLSVLVVGGIALWRRTRFS